MRFTFVGPLPPIASGIAQYSDMFVGALLESGHDVDAVTWASQYPSFVYKGTEALDGGPPAHGASAALRWWDPASWWRTGRRARDADAFLYSWVTPFQAPSYLAMMRAAHPTPSIAILHNALPHEPGRLDEPLARLTMSRSQGALAHSRDAAAVIARLAPHLAIERVGVPAILDVSPTTLPPTDAGVRCLFMGNIRPYKGLDTALDAMVALRDSSPSVRLTVAGHVWGSEAELSDEIARRGVGDVVDFRPGYVPDDEVDRLLSEHHLVLLPYKDSNQSGIVPLAHAAGRGVVATDVGGLAEALTDGVDAVVVPPDDPPALAAGILRAAGQLEELASASVRSQVPWSDLVDGIVALVERNR